MSQYTITLSNISLVPAALPGFTSFAPAYDVLRQATVTCIVLYASYLLLTTLYYAFWSPIKHVPGPVSSRFTRLPLKRAIMSGQRSFYIDALHKQYGPVVRIAPTEISVADVAGFKEIHKIGGGYVKSNWYGKLANFPKLGVFTMTDVKQHATRRRLLSRPFSRTHMVEHWESTVRGYMALAVQQMKHNAVEGKVDIFKWWLLLGSDVSVHLAFGESFSMLKNGKKTKLIEVLEKLTKGAGISVELPILRLLRYVPIKAIQETFNANEYIMQGASRAVVIAKSHPDEANIFAKVIREAEKDEGWEDMDTKIEAMNMIIAGTDTVGVTTCYLTWCVLSRPVIQQKLEEEVSALPEDFTEKDLLDLPWLNGVIEETLRLYGAAPSSLPRVVPQAGTVIAGVPIPGGYTVSTQAWTLHRDPKIWRAPNAFDPTRWMTSGDIPSPNAVSAEAKSVFCPFGAGSRSCLGLHAARMELRYATAFFFRELRGAKLAKSVTNESMAPLNFFLIAPKSHKCEIVLS